MSARLGGTPIPEPRWDTAVGLLRGVVGTGGRVGLFAHVNPDSDSLGSALALGMALRTAGADVVVSFDAEPFRVPDGLAFLPGLELLVPPSDVGMPLPLAITLDVGSPGRLGCVADLLADAGHIVVIDHHSSSTAFGGTRLVDPEAASTSVVVTQLLDRLGLPLTPEVATALYAGLVTDTGSFRQSSANPAAHGLAARLVAAGADPTSIGWSVWGIHRLDYVRLLAAVLSRVALEPAMRDAPDGAAGAGEAAGVDGSAAGGDDAALVWTAVTRVDFDAHNLDIEHVEGLIDVLWGVREAEVAAVLKELPGGGYTVSLRSRGRVDVGAVAKALGGGGHREKAGFITAEDTLGTVRDIKAALTSLVAVGGETHAEVLTGVAPPTEAVVPAVPVMPVAPQVAPGAQVASTAPVVPVAQVVPAAPVVPADPVAPAGPAAPRGLAGSR